MTASLSVELTHGPIERTSADVAIVTFFAVDRPLRGQRPAEGHYLLEEGVRIVAQTRQQGDQDPR